MSHYLEKFISPLIESQFPAFYHEEGPIFVEFVKTYFKWMESVSESRDVQWISEGISSLTLSSAEYNAIGTNTKLTKYFEDGDRIAISRGPNSNSYDIFTIDNVSNNSFLTLTTIPSFSESKCKFTTVSETGNPIFMTRHFDQIKDIDETFENFLVYFKEKYLKNLQFINVTNTRNLVKHSLDLYRSKGTERSLELLFRIAFGITPSTYYPSSDLFRLSDGHWYIPTYLEVSLNDNTPNYVNKQIYGMKSGATAFAESVVRRTVGNKLIDVMYISSINGAFRTGEPINTSEGVEIEYETPQYLLAEGRTNLLLSEKPQYNVPGWTINNLNLSSGFKGLLSTHGAIKIQTMGASSNKLLTITSRAVGSSAVTATFIVKKGNNVYPLGGLFLIRNQTTNTNLYSGSLNYDTLNVITSGSGSYVVTELEDGWLACSLRTSVGVNPGDILVCYSGYTGGVFGDGIYNYMEYVHLEDGIHDTPPLIKNTKKIQKQLNNSKNYPIITGSLTQIVIDNNGVGSNFQIGDEVTISSEKGQQGKSRVHQITNTAGTLSFELINGGYGYTNNFSVQVADKIISIANVQIANSDTSYFYPDDIITEPMVNINYTTANGTFAQNDEIFTYHANNFLKGTGRILSVGTINSTAGVLLTSVLSGNLDASNIYTTANSVGAALALSNAITNVSASGTVVDVDNNLILKVLNASSSFAENEEVFQYNAINQLTGKATVSRPMNSVAGSLYLDKVEGSFNVSFPIFTSGNANFANVESATIRVGVVTIGAHEFVNTGMPYVYGSNTSTTGYISIVPPGDGASVTLSSTLLYPEIVSVMDEPIAPYLNVAINALTYGFTGNASANLTNMSINAALSHDIFEVGKLSGIVSQSSGSTYGDKIMIRVIDPVTSEYNFGDTFELSISNMTTDFEVGEYVSQASTGARGIIKSNMGSTLLVERLNFAVKDTWAISNNAPSKIVGSSSGSNADITSIVLLSDDILGMNAIIESSLNTANGAISELHVTDSGFGFVDGETVNIMNANGDIVTGTASLQTHGFGSGFYLTQGGFLSANKKLFDGDYWQNFSYEVRSSRTLDKYVKMLKEVIHVSGTKIFGAFYHDTEVESEVDISTIISKS